MTSCKKSADLKYQSVSKEEKKLEKKGRSTALMGNNDVALTRLIGAATIITYFNIAYCVALIGPTLLDLLQLVSFIKF